MRSTKTVDQPRRRGAAASRRVVHTRDVGRRRRYPDALSESVSRIMQANPRLDTGPERSVRSRLYRDGFRYRKDFRIRIARATTRPDVAFVGLKVAAFIDGCFWHACPRHGSTPKHNAWYWGPKLRRNRARDRAATTALRTLGWTVIRAWEHDSPSVVAARIAAAVRRARVRRR